MSNLDTNHKKVIVLVHGIGANRLFMATLASRLRRRDYQVVNWGYRSLFSSIEKHAANLNRLMNELNDDSQVGSMYVVAHSMGSIVSRTALTMSIPEKMKRAVLMAPPNQGTPLATFFEPFVSWLIKPVSQLTHKKESFVNQLPADLGIPFGVIAASIDWIVPKQFTHLPTQKAHAVVPGIHSALVFRKDVVEMIDRFLQVENWNVDEGEDNAKKENDVTKNLQINN